MVIFVYGTLRPGGLFWDQLAPWVSEVGPTGVLGGHRLLAGDDYPLAVPAPHGAEGADDAEGPVGVVGEPVVVAGEHAAGALRVVDAIEGVPDLFTRVEVGGLWVYVATPDTRLTAGLRVVASGDWFDVEPGAARAWEATLGTPYLGPTCRYGPP